MRRIFKFIFMGSILLYYISCSDSRIVSPPLEQVRPTFQQMYNPVDSAFVFDVNSSLTLVFDEPMDVESFTGNFHLWYDELKTSEINGSFASDGNKVIFTPNTQLEDAHQYFTELRGRVQDLNGNGIDKDTSFVSGTEFFTSGEYSETRSPEFFICTGSEDILVKSYIDSTLLIADEVSSIAGFGRQTEMDFTLDGTKLIMSDYNSLNSGIYIINPETYVIEKKLTQNPTSNTLVKKSAEIAISDQYAYVINQDTKVISVVDLNSEEIVDDIAIPGIPKGLAISPDYSKLYVGSALDNRVWIYGMENNSLTNTITLDSLSQAVRLAVSADGKYLIVREFRQDRLLFVDTATDSFVNVIHLGYDAKSGNNNDLAVWGDYVFVSSESGKLTKIEVSTQTVIAELTHTNFQGLDIYPSGELLVATVRETPARLAIILPENLKIIRLVDLGQMTPWDVSIR